MNTMQSHMNKIQASIVQAYKIGITHGNSEKYRDTSDYELKIQKLCELEQAFTLEPQIIADLSETVEIEELDALYVKKLDEAIKDDANDSDRYRRFKKDIEDIKYTHDQHTNSEIKSSQTNIMSEDCDLEIEDETEVSCIDPITKKQITNPVRNKKCNHVYDFNSITSAIQQRRKMRCPYIGCSNKLALNVKDLVEDRELKRKISQSQNDNS